MPNTVPKPYSTRDWTLRLGYFAGITMGFSCLAVAAIYLFVYHQSNADAVNSALAKMEGKSLDTLRFDLTLKARLYTSGMALLSCGMFVGMAFGFLGFALFLLGVDGAIEVRAKSGGAEPDGTSPGKGWGLQITQLAPGAFVILIAAVVVCFCASNRPVFRTSATLATGTGSSEGEGEGEDPAVSAAMGGRQGHHSKKKAQDE